MPPKTGFRIRSYRNGATAIEGYPESIAAILKIRSARSPTSPGSVKDSPPYSREIEATGSCDERNSLLEKYPPTALEFLKIQGLGPKSIALLFEHFRITTMDELEQLCRDQKLRDLPRMGAKLEEKVLRSIAQYRLRTGRFLLSFGQQTADELIADLSGDGIESIIPAGSLRRGRETVGDLDLLVTGPRTARWNAWRRIRRVHEVLGRGVNKTSVKLGREGLQVDVARSPRESFGAAMQYFTGSKEHNVAIRQRAVRTGTEAQRVRSLPLEEIPKSQAKPKRAFTRLSV